MAATPDALFQQIQALRESNGRLIEERETLNRKARELLEKRNKFNEEFRKLAAEVKELRARRDELNSKVKELKSSRNLAREAAVSEREKLDKLSDRSRKISERIEGSPRKALEEFNRLEWKLQTTILTPKAEKEFIRRLKELEGQVLVAKKVQEYRDKITGTKAAIGGRRLQAQSLHEQMTKVVEESEVIHNKLVEMAEAASKVRSEADQAHAEFVEACKGADNAHNGYITNLVKIRELRQRVSESGQYSKLRKAQEVREKLEKSGSEKLEQGKRLSLEEFKALMEKGAI